MGVSELGEERGKWWEPQEAAKLSRSSFMEERRRNESSGGMTEEQVKRWSKHEEPRHGAEGGSDEKRGVDTEGMYSEGWAKDDRCKRGAADSDISTSGGGITMGAEISSSSTEVEIASRGVDDPL